MLVFDYTKAIAQVNELRQIAKDMGTMRNSVLNDAINEIQSGWQGDTAVKFIGKCDDLSGFILNEVNNINTLADNLERTSNSIRQAELEAMRILRESLLRTK